MSFENAKLLYIFSCFLLGLIILSPTFFAVIPLPESESFSELWLLGPNRMIESGAVNVMLNQPFTFHLGVSNHMGSLEYYTVFVKFLNESQALYEPGAMFSSLEPVFEYRLFLRNNETWENAFIFSFENVTFKENVGRVSMILINGNTVSVDKLIVRDDSDGGFYCQMLFELWIYNSTISDLQFHNRAATFWININRQF